MKSRYDYQGTLHALGAELPLSLGDGWRFAGSCVREGDAGPFLFVRWRRRIGGAR